MNTSLTPQGYLVILLAAIAAVVLCLLSAGQSAWGWIIVYWAVLTAKNALDIHTVIRKETHEDHPQP